MFINKVIHYQKTVRYGTVRRNQMFESFTVLLNPGFIFNRVYHLNQNKNKKISTLKMNFPTRPERQSFNH
jgi:hypothetical protein